MGLVVSLGLERFYYDDPDALAGAVVSLVEGGYTTLVREVVAPKRSHLDEAKVLEVSRHKGAVRSRWFDAAEAEPVLVDIGKAYAKYDTYASFAWDELEKVSAYNVSSLALTLDGAEKPPRRGIALPRITSPLSVTDLTSSLRNWSARHPQARAAAAFHKLAQKHRLIVHSA